VEDLPTPVPSMTDPATGAAVSDSAWYLASDEARAALERDPYWPKWDSPWWHMVALWEMGLASQIPQNTAEILARLLDSHYLKHFPLPEEPLPPGCEETRHVPCHCQLGTAYQVLFACGIEVAGRLPWLRRWFLRHQLFDGGLNCDNAAYAKPSGKSSPLSTLPALEAILLCSRGLWSRDEEEFLDRGAAYLLAHRVFKSSDGSRVPRAEWTQVCFPRFYDYDLLRGLRFLAEWVRRRNQPLAKERVAEALEILGKQFPDGKVYVQRPPCENASTLAWEDGRWRPGASPSRFPLLDLVTRPGTFSPWLTREWEDTRRALS